MRYKVNIKKTEEGYSIWVPGLPGCWSQGQTEEESLENIKDAIQEYLETVDELRNFCKYYKQHFLSMRFPVPISKQISPDSN